MSLKGRPVTQARRAAFSNVNSEREGRPSGNGATALIPWCTKRRGNLGGLDYATVLATSRTIRTRPYG
jgi:hypothetical protein